MSELPFDMTDDLQLKLLAIGWSVDRRVDISDDVTVALQGGWIIFPIAQAVIEQFDHLGHRSNIQFNLNDVGSNWPKDFNGKGNPDFSAFERENKVRLYPLAIEDGWSPVFIADSGLLVQFTDDQSNWLGANSQACFERLFEQMYMHRPNKEHS